MRKYNIFNKKSVLFLGLTMSMFCAFAQYPTNGLKGYWSLNGNANDASGYNNNGTMQGGAVFCPDRFGTANSAVKFGGFFNPSAIFVPNSPSLVLTNELTIACWFKTDSLTGMRGNAITSYDTNYFSHAFITKDGDRGGFDMRFTFNKNNNRATTNFRINNGTTCSNTQTYSYYNSRNCMETEWVHIAVVVDSISITMYLNGIQFDRQTYNPPITFTEANNKNLHFGRYGYNCNTSPYRWFPLNGKMDDIFYYNRALSQAEVWDLMSYPQVYVTPGLITTTLTDYATLGQPYEKNGFSLPVQNQAGTFNYSHSNGCDSMWNLTLNICEPDTLCTGDSIALVAEVEPSNLGFDLQWFVNDTAYLGATNDTFSYAPNDGDFVYCRFTTNEQCVADTTLYSEGHCFVVKPRPAVSVSVVADTTEVCDGTSVRLTATPTNGGNPTYKWLVNGQEREGETGAIFTYTPSNGDAVTCEVYSSLDCAEPFPAVSVPVNITVNPMLSPTISIRRRY